MKSNSMCLAWLGVMGMAVGLSGPVYAKPSVIDNCIEIGKFAGDVMIVPEPGAKYDLPALPEALSGKPAKNDSGMYLTSLQESYRTLAAQIPADGLVSDSARAEIDLKRHELLHHLMYYVGIGICPNGPNRGNATTRMLFAMTYRQKEANRAGYKKLNELNTASRKAVTALEACRSQGGAVATTGGKSLQDIDSAIQGLRNASASSAASP